MQCFVGSRICRVNLGYYVVTHYELHPRLFSLLSQIKPSTFNIIAMEKIQNFLFIPASVTITDTVNVNECSCCLILLQWLLIVFIYVPLSNDIKYSVILFRLQACMAGIVFAKFTKPTMRAETILFSKNALITVRNGSMYLVCRIADLRFLKKCSKNNIFHSVLFFKWCFA